MSADARAFLDLDPAEHTLERSRVVVLPVPYAETVSYRGGAHLGPAAILRASAEMEDYDPEFETEPCAAGIHTLPPLADLSGGPEAVAARVADVVGGLAVRGKAVCMLGGEHSLSAGAVAGAARHVGDLSVLVLDAHADLRDEYQGWRYSHACAVRRILDQAPATLVGVRSMATEEAAFIRETAIPCFERGADAIDDVSAIIDTLSPNVYVSVDLDVFDPSVIAAVGTPEPGGMGWWETLRLLRAVGERRRIIAFDVMELAPSEGPEAGAYAAAKLAYKLAAYACLPLRSA
ncbi:MAG: agmatinase [Dehalococcoidia bacterium]|nr:agmatinase [Dehalococcoidia bacterium]